MTPQQRVLSDASRSGFQMYKELAVGRDASLVHLIGYEASQLFLANLPGLLGFGARALLYPHLFATCGKRPAIGRGVLIRVPRKISLGKGVLIDDGVALDVRGEEAAITLHDHVSIGRLSIVAAKHGTIQLGAGCNVGSYCRIATNSVVDIGESTLIGAYCYIGPGNHTEGSESLISSPMEIKGGVSIGKHSWLGARVTVLDGVKIGAHAIIGAHSLVREDVPDWGVAVGAPAKVIRIRNRD
jgi:acetyltransferase-like isoleucine patch superfamily enzyme